MINTRDLLNETTVSEKTRRYEAVFGEGDVEIYSTPGRCEIGGNHTDHQHGKVLAAAVNLDMTGIAGYNEEAVINLWSEGYGKIEIPLDTLDKQEGEAGSTTALVRGVAAYLVERGYILKGFNICVFSQVPEGMGLSSSAAFEVLIGTVISGLFNDGRIPKEVLALAGQYSENIYFEKPCGLMDQMACAWGGLIHIDFENPDNPQVTEIEGDFGEYQLCITDTKGTHKNLTADYEAIPAEMKKVAEYFGKTVLREVKEADFYECLRDVREQTGDRAVLRAMHFFEEEHRVTEEAEALNRGDMQAFLKVVRASGDSSFKYLQNVYRTRNIDSQNLSLALALSEKILGEDGVSRVHGGGFAGTIEAFVKMSRVADYQRRIEAVFGPGTCWGLSIRKEGTMKILG
ncbi:MAG: galactokinase [Clostridia bacterium]|nr:galactokinase family protein [Lachnospiraceae bacterium]NCC01036.1 galactokinase [Clostridia bacterium]NCD02968.1 galactokinase [Clostridia bacterium]